MYKYGYKVPLCMKKVESRVEGGFFFQKFLKAFIWFTL